MTSIETATLPHDDYMEAVVDALSARGIPPSQWWTSEDDSGAATDRLDAVVLWSGIASPDHWPHGVYLTWDQYDGWRLIEEGGARTIWALSEDSLTYSDPRQVAADVAARLTHGMDGWTPGPVCIDGPRWDSRATQAAVTRWETAYEATVRRTP